MAGFLKWVLPLAPTALRKGGALLFGLTCHSLFAVAVWQMATVLYSGFSASWGTLTGWSALVANASLLLQFPLIHSWLLTKRGRSVLAWLSYPYGQQMTTTTYVIISSVQLIGVCVLWSPSGTVWHPFAPPLAHLSNLAYGASWLFLAKAMLDSGLSLQSGALGWLSVFRGKQPKYPDMPERGTFRHSRQPIYLAFLLILISSPVWTPDKVFFAIFWGSYLVFAPRLKERRLERAYGERFRAYQKRTPYFLPHLPAVPAPVKAFASFILHLLN